MPTHSQKQHPSGRVVSVRLDDSLLRRLDGLEERTKLFTRDPSQGSDRRVSIAL